MAHITIAFYFIHLLPPLWITSVVAMMTNVFEACLSMLNQWATPNYWSLQQLDIFSKYRPVCEPIVVNWTFKVLSSVLDSIPVNEIKSCAQDISFILGIERAFVEEICCPQLDPLEVINNLLPGQSKSERRIRCPCEEEKHFYTSY